MKLEPVGFPETPAPE